MRVLHVSAGNLYGGLETLLVTLARHRGHCPGMGPAFAVCFPGRLREELSVAGVPVHDLGPARVSRPWTVLAARRRLGRLLWRERFDVVVCHGAWPHALFGPVARRLGLPLVFWAHDVPTGRHWLERWARRTPPDLAIANSRATQEALRALFPRCRGEVIYPPVPAPPVLDRDSVRRAVRAELGTPADAGVIVMACRLEPLKGHAVLLEALSRLADRSSWACWIAGGAQRPAEAEYLASLQERSREYDLAGRVRFLGQRSDVPRLLAAADVFCQPNTGPEGFGIAFVEALYAGLPVVTTAIGGAPEVVEETCGVLVPPGDAQALADVLRGLIEDPGRRRAVGAAGPARARELCDPVGQLAKLADILAGVRPSPVGERR
jgi:glycosyltransferase involved in cell wall biosynthesis